MTTDKNVYRVEEIMFGKLNPSYDGEVAMTTKEVDSNRPKQRTYVKD